MFRLHLYCREVYVSCVDVRGVGGCCGGGSGGGGDAVGDDAVGGDAAQFSERHRRCLIGNVVGDAGNAERHPHFSAADVAV